MIIICDKCLEILRDYGALVFSPPDDDGKTDKLHICKSCWEKLEKEIKQ